MKVKSESEVTQSGPTPRDPMDCSLPGSSVHGIFQARVLEWGVIAFSDRASRQSKYYCITKVEKERVSLQVGFHRAQPQDQISHVKLRQKRYLSLFLPEAAVILIDFFTQIPKASNCTADTSSGTNFKTIQKGICGKPDNQIGTLHTELTFPKITNWLRCFPRFPWNQKKFSHMRDSDRITRPSHSLLQRGWESSETTPNSGLVSTPLSHNCSFNLCRTQH